VVSGNGNENALAYFGIIADVSYKNYHGQDTLKFRLEHIVTDQDVPEAMNLLMSATRSIYQGIRTA